VSDKYCRRTRQHTFYVQQFFLENVAVYGIMWKNTVERGRPQMTIWRMRIACWIPKTTNTHTGCVILIAFPLQQWLHERTSVLRHTYIGCLVACWKQQTDLWGQLLLGWSVECRKQDVTWNIRFINASVILLISLCDFIFFSLTISHQLDKSYSVKCY